MNWPQMRLAALFSGGKDSTYAVYLAERMGHRVKFLLTVYPRSDESLYFHYPNIRLTKLQAEAMGKRHLALEAGEDELDALRRLIARVSGQVEGVVSGAVASRFQRERFRKICEEYGLRFLAPLWGKRPTALLHEVLEAGFQVMVTGVAAEGLGRDWLGVLLTYGRVKVLEELEKRLGVNPAGEGGELETLVLDCPLFSKRIEVKRYDVRWMGDRGILLVLEAGLVEKR